MLPHPLTWRRCAAARLCRAARWGTLAALLLLTATAGTFAQQTSVSRAFTQGAYGQATHHPGYPSAATAATAATTSAASAAPTANAAHEPGAAKTPIQRPNIASGSKAKSTSSTSSLWMTYAILGLIVGGVMFGGRWLRKVSPGRFGMLDGAIDVLGSRPLTQQHALHVVQVGERVLIVGTGPDGVRTLSEINDPAEALHVSSLCRAAAKPISPRTASRSRSGTPQTSVAPPPAEEIASPFSREELRRSFVRSGLVLLTVGLLNASTSAQDHRDRYPVYPSAYRNDAPAYGRTPTPVASQAVEVQRPVSPLWSLPTEPTAAPVVSPTVGIPPVAQPAVIHSAVVHPAVAMTTSPSAALSPPATNSATAESSALSQVIRGADLSSTFKLLAIVGVMSLAPAILMMTTCYVRIIVVLGLLRQAMGTMQFPPTQVLTSLSLFLTALVMWPVWETAYREGIQPYTQATFTSDAQRDAALQTAIQRTLKPARSFMVKQIEATDNEATVDLFLRYQSATMTSESSSSESSVEFYEDVPTRVLLPSYLLSELKTAFLIGFQIFLPFVVIDLVVSSVLASLGLVVLPPAVVALPLKLLLFVVIDGWHLTVELLLTSVAAVG